MGSREGAQRRLPNVLLCLTGSVASIKAEQLVEGLRSSCAANVRVVATQRALHFLRCQQAVEAKRLSAAVYSDEEEWSSWGARGDPVLHITLRRWADVLVIAPLSANTLAKLAAGLADNLVTCVARAWDFGRPVVVAPAMNTAMWEHPCTARHLAELQALGMHIVPPATKRLVCGDTGIGAMAEVETIANAVLACLQAHREEPASPQREADVAAALAELEALDEARRTADGRTE
jgi:phosphopantothenoylcysteine decarboxylase